MPEATYIPLDGGSSRSCNWWSNLTGLEKGLIFLSLTLAIFVFGLTVALVTYKGESPETTVAPTSTSTTPVTPTSPIPSTKLFEAPSSTPDPKSSTTTASPKPSPTTIVSQGTATPKQS